MASTHLEVTDRLDRTSFLATIKDVFPCIDCFVSYITYAACFEHVLVRPVVSNLLIHINTGYV